VARKCINILSKEHGEAIITTQEKDLASGDKTYFLIFPDNRNRGFPKCQKNSAGENL
jgi:hypothetical protein